MENYRQMPQTIEKKEFNCSYLDEISLSGLFLRSKVPQFQKTTACRYAIIKKIFSYTVVQPKVTNVEYDRLKTLGFFPLENTDGERMCSELMKIIEWANSGKQAAITAAQEVFEIRVKELKYISANTSQVKLREFCDGYRVLDKYLEFIAG